MSDKGPSTDPCGTPETTGSEQFQSNTIENNLLCMPHQKGTYPLCKWPLTPYQCNLDNLPIIYIALILRFVH